MLPYPPPFSVISTVPFNRLHFSNHRRRKSFEKIGTVGCGRRLILIANLSSGMAARGGFDPESCLVRLEPRSDGVCSDLARVNTTLPSRHDEEWSGVVGAHRDWPSKILETAAVIGRHVADLLRVNGARAFFTSERLISRSLPRNEKHVWLALVPQSD